MDSEADSCRRAVNNNMMPTSPARPQKSPAAPSSAKKRLALQRHAKGADNDDDDDDDVSSIIAGSHAGYGQRNSRSKERRGNRPARRQARPPQVPTLVSDGSDAKSRGEKVREARRKKIEQEQAERKAALARKNGMRSAGNAADASSEVSRLEKELHRSDLSNAAKQGLKKQIAKLKATAIREQRKREQREREAVRKEKQRLEAEKQKAAA